MAVDTLDKRYAAMNIMNVWRGPATFPSGSISGVDRQSLLFLYPGIIIDVIVATASSFRMMVGYGL